MAIQILNASLLLFAGFLAGHYFADSPSQVNARTEQENKSISSSASVGAVARPTAASLTNRRGPASANSSVSTDVAPVDLAVYLIKFGIADVHEACEFAQSRFSNQTVAANARFIEGLDNFKEHKNYLTTLGQRLAVDEKFWVGRGELEIEGNQVRVEVIMDSHSFLPEADGEDQNSCFRAHVRMNLTNGHQFSSVLDACTDSLVTKNRSYYLNWETYGDIEIGRKISAMQIPLPESLATELEFLRTDNTWSLSQGFNWSAVSLETGLQMIDQHSPAMAATGDR